MLNIVNNYKFIRGIGQKLVNLSGVNVLCDFLTVKALIPKIDFLLNEFHTSTFGALGLNQVFFFSRSESFFFICHSQDFFGGVVK